MNVHERLDAAVAAAYGWPADLSDAEVLERLLALNLERYEEEGSVGDAARGGLWRRGWGEVDRGDGEDGFGELSAFEFLEQGVETFFGVVS